MKEHLQAIITVLSLVNPVVCGAMFARIEANSPRDKQVADASKAALAMVVILSLAALIGIQLLHLFGVSLDAFMVAGGGVLAWMGFSMLSGQGLSVTSPDASANSGASLTPLILFAASPGTITGVITLSAADRGPCSGHRLGGRRRGGSRDLADDVARRAGRPVMQVETVSREIQ